MFWLASYHLWRCGSNLSLFVVVMCIVQDNMMEWVLSLLWEIHASLLSTHCCRQTSKNFLVGCGSNSPPFVGLFLPRRYLIVLLHYCTVASWQGGGQREQLPPPLNFGSGRTILSENVRPEMQNLRLKTPILGKFWGKNWNFEHS